MRKKLEALLDKHYNNYRFSDPLHGEIKDYVLDAMEEVLTLYGVSDMFSAKHLKRAFVDGYNAKECGDDCVMFIENYH